MTTRTAILARTLLVMIAIVAVISVVAALRSGPSAEAFSKLNDVRQALLIAAICTAVVPFGISLTLRHGKAFVVSIFASVAVMIVTAFGVFLI